MFPAFLDFHVDEMHLEMASREFAETRMSFEEIAKHMDVAVGIIDVKSYYIETPEDVAARIRRCLQYAAAGAAGIRAGLRPEPDGAMGGSKRKLRAHGRKALPSYARRWGRMIRPVAER